MARHIGDVGDPAHDERVADFVEVSAVHGQVVAGMFAQIGRFEPHVAG